MRKIFVADDSSVKREDVCKRLHYLFPTTQIVECTTGAELCNRVLYYYNSAVIKEPNEHLIVMSMQMPLFEGEPVRFDCGKTVLAKLQCHSIKCPAIVVSPDHVNDKELSEVYDHYAGSVYYIAFTAQEDLYKLRLDEYYYKQEKSAEEINK